MQINDKIKFNDSIGTVKQIYTFSTGKFVTIEFGDPVLGYFTTNYPYDYADMFSDKPIDPDKCPNCNTPWHISRFNMHIWKDCKPCGKTWETITTKKEQE